MQWEAARLAARKWILVFGMAISCALLPPSKGAPDPQEERKVKSKVTPEYPEIARRMNMAGVAKVEVIIAPSGEVRQVKELGGNPVLVEALSKAVRLWKFEPAGKETIQEVKFEFKRSG